MKTKCILLCLLLTGCQPKTRVITRIVPPSPTTSSYETNYSIPVFSQQATVVQPPRITNAISLGWDISKSDLGFVVYHIYGKHNVNSTNWVYLGSTSGLVCTITNINLAPMSVFRVVASNTTTHITSDMLVHQLQQ